MFNNDYLREEEDYRGMTCNYDTGEWVKKPSHEVNPYYDEPEPDEDFHQWLAWEEWCNEQAELEA